MAKRAAGRARTLRALAGAGLAAGLGLTLAAPASAVHDQARVFIDPADVCFVPAPPASFADRSSIPDVHLPSVDCAAAQDIVRGMATGSGPMSYMGSRGVTREQMASYIVRTLKASGYADALPAPAAGDPFPDVPRGSTHGENVAVLKQIGVTLGKKDGTYDAKSVVPRDQMASFLVRSAEWAYQPQPADGIGQPDNLQESVDVSPGVTGPPVSPATFPAFTDVPPTHTHYLAIRAAGELVGLTNGTTATTYGPTMPVRRDQMASFIIRLQDSVLTAEADLAAAG